MLLFSDFTSLAAFTSSLLPARLDSIQSTGFHQDHDTLRDKLREDGMFRGSSNYQALHDNKVESRNAILPLLPHAISPGNDKNVKVWSQVLGLLRKLPSLRELKVQIIINPTPPEQHYYEATNQIPDSIKGVFASVDDEFWGPEIIERWQDFNVSSDTYTSAYSWYLVSVKTLEKKRARIGYRC